MIVLVTRMVSLVPRFSLTVDGIERAQFHFVGATRILYLMGMPNAVPYGDGFRLGHGYYGPNPDLMAYREAMALRQYRDSLEERNRDKPMDLSICDTSPLPGQKIPKKYLK